MKIRNLTLLTIIANLLISSLAWADPSWYRVEIIAFANKSTASIKNEVWPEYPPLPSVSNTQELVANTNHQFYKPYEILPKSSQTLDKEEATLLASKRYRVLFHYAWLQQLTGNNNKPVHLYAGDVDAKGKRSKTETDAIYSETPYGMRDEWQLDGFVTLTKSNYINLTSNFVFNILASELDGGASLFSKKDDTIHFRMLQSRKLRPNELHYIDSPLFGLLVKVTPYT